MPFCNHDWGYLSSLSFRSQKQNSLAISGLFSSQTGLYPVEILFQFGIDSCISIWIFSRLQYRLRTHPFSDFCADRYLHEVRICCYMSHRHLALKLKIIRQDILLLIHGYQASYSTLYQFKVEKYWITFIRTGQSHIFLVWWWSAVSDFQISGIRNTQISSNF